MKKGTANTSRKGKETMTPESSTKYWSRGGFFSIGSSGSLINGRFKLPNSSGIKKKTSTCPLLKKN